MVVLCCIVVVTGFLPFPVSRSSLSSPPSQVRFKPVRPGIAMASLVLDAEVLPPGCCGVWQGSFGTPVRKEMQFNRHVFGA